MYVKLVRTTQHAGADTAHVHSPIVLNLCYSCGHQPVLWFRTICIVNCQGLARQPGSSSSRGNVFENWGHSYQLPEYSTDLHKKSRLIRCLYSFVEWNSFWFCCFVLYVNLTLLFMFIIGCVSVASNKYYIHTYIYTAALDRTRPLLDTIRRWPSDRDHAHIRHYLHHLKLLFLT